MLGLADSEPRIASHRSPLRALRRSWRSIVRRPTAPRGSKRMCCDSALRLVDERDEVAFLDRLLGFDVDLADDTRYLRHHRDFHLHGLQDHDLVTFGDELPFFGNDLPDVGGDLGPDLVHAARAYKPSAPPLVLVAPARFWAALARPKP